jgi:hypothetical protein
MHFTQRMNSNTEELQPMLEQLNSGGRNKGTVR